VPTAQGNVNNSLGTTGYFKTTAPGYAPAFSFLGQPLSEGTLTASPGDSPYMLTLSQFGDPTVGSVYALVGDCFTAAAPGVKVTTDNPNLGDANYYIGGPNEKGMPGEQSTDSSGVAVFSNVPEGPLTLTATPVALGHPSSTMSIYVHAGATTEVGLAPTP
jgi:hypothetical protein